MRIYLNNQLLVKSRVFSDEEKYEEKYGRRENFDCTNRDWEIFTWNSLGKLTAFPDFTSRRDKNTIEAKLDVYSPIVPKSKREVRDEFDCYNITSPDHQILISGYNSFIETPKETIINIVNRLEDSKIPCLVGNCAAPLMSHVEYMSPQVKEWLNNPIEVEL